MFSRRGIAGIGVIDEPLAKSICPLPRMVKLVCPVVGSVTCTAVPTERRHPWHRRAEDPLVGDGASTSVIVAQLVSPAGMYAGR
jgi:hypothetical protein